MKTVTAAILIRDKKIFIAQRPQNKSLAHFWELPGGKQEPGETLPECLKRELSEELNIDAKIGDFFMTSVYKYDFGTIELHSYFASVSPEQEVVSNEHENTAWVSPQELSSYNFAPADVEIIARLSKLKL